MDLEPFWLQKPSVLFTSLTIIPQAEWSVNRKLNALTRFVLLVVVLLFFLSVGGWLWFLILGIALILCLFFFYGERSVQTFICPKPTPQGRKFVPLVRNW